jgi:putative cell wall-binding protein
MILAMGVGVGLIDPVWAASPGMTSVTGPPAVAAATMATSQYPSGATTAILTSGQAQNLADAVTAAPLARVLNAPILLTDSPSVVGNVASAALQVLKVKRVILIGADNNASLRHQLPSGLTVVGYSGATRYQTAAAVFRAVEQAGGNRDAVFFASGNNANLTDALTVDPVAAAEKIPVLLVPPTGGLPKAYAALVRPSITSYVVGAAVSYHETLPHPVDLAGVDRYTTADLVNQRFFPHPSGIVITNASYLFDSLIASPYAGAHDMPMVMVNTTMIPGPSYDYLAAVAPEIKTVLTVGSAVAVSPAMQRAVTELLAMDD